MRIYAGDTIGIPLEWFDVVFAIAGTDSFDGVSVHPYGYLLTPEWQVRRLEKLRALIRKHNGGKDMPICVSEQGWYTTEPGTHGKRAAIDEATQAKYLVRAWVLFMANGVEEAYWYLGRDDDMFGTMGLLRKDYSPKPAFHAYAQLVRMLGGKRFVRRVDGGDENLHCYEFEGGVRVRWKAKSEDVAETVPVYETDNVRTRLQPCPEIERTQLELCPHTLTPLDLADCEYVNLIKTEVIMRGTQALQPVTQAVGPVLPLAEIIVAEAQRPPLQAWLGWDPATLKFKAIIKDEIHCNTHHGWMGWKGDNIQLGFSTAMPWTGGEWSEPWHEFNMQLGSKGPEITGIEGAEVSVVRDEAAKTTTYEVALPWSELSGDGKPCDFSFAFYVNENDGGGRKGFWKWGDIKRLDGMRAFRLGIENCKLKIEN